MQLPGQVLADFRHNLIIFYKSEQMSTISDS